MDSSAWSAERRSDALSSFLRTGRTHRTHAAYPRYGHDSGPAQPPGTFYNQYTLSGTNGNKKLKMELTEYSEDFQVVRQDLEFKYAYYEDSQEFTCPYNDSQIKNVRFYMKENQPELEIAIASVGTGLKGANEYEWQETGAVLKKVVYRIALTMISGEILAFSVRIPNANERSNEHDYHEMDTAADLKRFLSSRYQNTETILSSGEQEEEAKRGMQVFVRGLDSFKRVTDARIMNTWRQNKGIERLFLGDWIVKPVHDEIFFLSLSYKPSPQYVASRVDVGNGASAACPPVPIDEHYIPPIVSFEPC